MKPLENGPIPSTGVFPSVALPFGGAIAIHHGTSEMTSVISLWVHRVLLEHGMSVEVDLNTTATGSNIFLAEAMNRPNHPTGGFLEDQLGFHSIPSFPTDLQHRSQGVYDRLSSSSTAMLRSSPPAGQRLPLPSSATARPPASTSRKEGPSTTRPGTKNRRTQTR